MDELYFDDWASPVAGMDWASTEYPTDAIGNYAFDDYGVGRSYAPSDLPPLFDVNQFYDYPTDPGGNYAFDDWAQSNVVPASQMGELPDVQNQGALGSLFAKAQQSWNNDPWKWISTIGGGALGLATGLQQQSYYRKLIEEQKRRAEEIAKRNAQINRPLFEGRPAPVASAYDFNVPNYARYGAGPEHAFRTAGPSFSRADFAGAAGGPLSRLVQGPGGGQDDSVTGRLSPGEYIFDSEAVSALGDGSNEEGARKLDRLRINLRKHKRKASAKRIPPKAKAPEAYMKGGK